MTHDQRQRYLTRDGILSLLSDAEVASVSTAETAERLTDGDEYIDLTNLEQGVQRAHGETMTMGPVLARKAVQDQTWQNVVEQLVVLESVAESSRA